MVQKDGTLQDKVFMSKARAPVIWVILFCFSLSSISAIGDWGDYLVTNKAAKVLEGPDNGFLARTTLEEGQLVVELDRIRGFVQVRIPDKSHLSGWIRDRNLRLIRKWKDAAEYPEGHPAATGEIKYSGSREEQSQPRHLNAGLWSLLVAATMLAAVFVLVWRNRLHTGRGDIRASLWERALFRIREPLCRLICDARIEKPPEDESGTKFQ